VRRRSVALAGACAAILTLAGCSGGSDVASNAAVDPNPQPLAVCDGQCTTPDSFLTVSDIKTILAQGIAEARARQAQATFAVTDRVGNVLAVYRMGDPATRKVAIASEFDAFGNPVVRTGLTGIQIPVAKAPVNLDQLAAIAKAITGSYLSSEGNAFSTRTASFIVQENFVPLETNAPAGPLFGVQFSQLACSDTIRSFNGTGPSVGIQRSPLGLSADPGGFPLYKKGAPVGAVSAIADGRYSLDKNPRDLDKDLDEQIAWAATFGFAAPVDIRADRAAVINGKPLAFSDVTDSDLLSSPRSATAFDAIPASVGALIAVRGYVDANIHAGTAYLTAASGVVRAPTSLYAADRNACMLVDENGNPRFPPRDALDGAVLNGTQPLQANEVREIISQALGVAAIARAGIRAGGNQAVRVNVHVIDSMGDVLGNANSCDAPAFGSQVSLQKARSAALASSPTAAVYLNSLPPARYLTTNDTTVDASRTVNIGDYVTAARGFFNDPDALTGKIAFADRSFGSISQPYFPSGTNPSPISGPFSKPINDWSVFSTGLQFDLISNAVLQHVLFAVGALNTDVSPGCAGVALAPDLSSVSQTQPGSLRAASGIQIFPGSVPIFRGNTLVGAIGVSGDGVDQDDMVAFLGLDRAGVVLNTGVGNAPRAMRADTLAPAGSPIQSAPLRYVQCPQKPFLNSDQQRVCEGK